MIRLATPSDIPGIYDLGTRLHRASLFSHTAMNFKALTNRMLRAIGSKDEWCAVAVYNGKIVGCMILVTVKYWWTENEHYVLDDGFFVERPGLGIKLIRAGLRWASKRDVKEVIVAVNSGIAIERTMRVLNRCGLEDRGTTVSLRVAKSEGMRWAA